MSIEDIIKGGATEIDRHVYIKRIEQDGSYEQEWREITDDVIYVSSIIDDAGDTLLFGDFQIFPTTLKLNNKDRRYNSTDIFESLFRGYRQRHETKVKIEYNHVAIDGTIEKGKTFYGMIQGDSVISDEGDITFTIFPITNIFKKYFPFNNIDVSSATTANLVDRIVKMEIGGQRIFDKYFEGANDSERYQIESHGAMTISSPLIRENESCFQKLSHYSAYEDGYFYVNNEGNFVFKINRNNSESLKWKFNGAGSSDNQYGINIMSVSKKRATSMLYNRIVIEYQSNTFVTASDEFTPGDGSSTDIYGHNNLNLTLLELSESEAQIVANRLLANYKTIKNEYSITTYPITHLNLSDKCEFNYAGELTTGTPFIIGVSEIGGSDVIAGFAGAINEENIQVKITRQELDYMQQESKFTLREI